MNGVMVMFVGMGKSFWGLRVSFFMDFKVASKNWQKLSQSNIKHATDVYITFDQTMKLF